MNDHEVLMASNTIADCASVGNRALGAEVWAKVVGSGDQELITAVLDRLTMKLVSWMRLVAHPSDPPHLTPTAAATNGSVVGLDLTDRAAGLLVVDLVNLGLDNEWEKRAERLAGGRSMMLAVAAGEQALQFLFDIPDSTRVMVGLN